MSRLTEAILIFTDGRDEDVVEAVMASVNEHIATRGGEYESDGQGFENLHAEERAGGNKVGSSIWAACFNYVDPDDVRRAVASGDWGDDLDARSVVLLLDFEHWDDVSWRKETVADIRERMA